MNEVEHHNTYKHNNHNQHTAIDYDIAHHHMDSYQASITKIASDHHAHINDHIAQVKNAQTQLERAKHEWGLESQAHHRRGIDMGL